MPKLQKMERKRDGRPHVQFYVTIPKALVDALGWEKGDDLDVKLVDSKLCLEKVA